MRTIEEEIRAKAHDRCEYCRVVETAGGLKHVLDHIIARQHGGTSVEENLALACARCNQFKGPNIAGLDPETRLLTALFNPRVQLWPEHFRFVGAVVEGLTPTGRTTCHLLMMNHPLRVMARQELIDEGLMRLDE